MVTAVLAVLLAGAAAWLWLSDANTAHREHRILRGHLGNPGSQGTGPHDPLRPVPAPTSSRGRGAGQAADTEEYAKFVRQLAALLRSGTGPAAAFGLLADLWVTGGGRVGADIHAGASRALAQLQTGGTLQQGLRAHAEIAWSQTGSQAGNRRLWTRLAWCLAICEESGAALADLLDTLAEDAETSADMHRALHSALAGPRATSRLLTYLPAIGLGLGQLLGINPLAVLTGNPAGRVALVAGVCLWLGNRIWCARMLRAIADKVPS